MVRFEPTWEELELYKDGGVAIIDQWVCSHARCSARGAFGFNGSTCASVLVQGSVCWGLQGRPQGLPAG